MLDCICVAYVPFPNELLTWVRNLQIFPKQEVLHSKQRDLLAIVGREYLYQREGGGDG